MRSIITFELLVVSRTVWPGMVSVLVKSIENNTGPSGSAGDIVFEALKFVPLPVVVANSPFMITVGAAIRSVLETIVIVTTSSLMAPPGFSAGPEILTVFKTGAPYTFTLSMYHSLIL